MDHTLFGFDRSFDRTAVETRRQAPARVAIGILVFLSGLTAMSLPVMLAWAAMLAAGDDGVPPAMLRLAGLA